MASKNKASENQTKVKGSGSQPQKTGARGGGAQSGRGASTKKTK
jgi:hypothetical protein